MQLEILDNGLEPASAGAPHPLLLVHGAGCGASVWHDMLDWFADAGVAASALSLRGHGNSAGSERLHSFRIMDYVADLAAAVGSMRRAPVLVGHSMGGLVVQKLLESIDLPGAVLLASSPVGGMWRDGLRMSCRWPGRFMAAVFRRSLPALYARDASARWLLLREDADPALVGRALEAIQEESWRAILDMSLLVRPQPARVTTPVFVLAAADDHMVAPASSARTAKAYAARMEVIENCGHMMMLEDVWPTVAARIRDWCRQPGSSA